MSYRGVVEGGERGVLKRVVKDVLRWCVDKSIRNNRV